MGYISKWQLSTISDSQEITSSHSLATKVLLTPPSPTVPNPEPTNISSPNAAQSHTRKLSTAQAAFSHGSQTVLALAETRQTAVQPTTAPVPRDKAETYIAKSQNLARHSGASPWYHAPHEPRGDQQRVAVWRAKSSSKCTPVIHWSWSDLIWLVPTPCCS